MMPPALTTAEQVCHLDVVIGQFFAHVAKELADDHGGVDAVCSHGQTIYHWVEASTAKGTLQLGEPAWIAESTGAAVVSDVRNRDIATGGHGAPLASLLDVLLLGTAPAVPCGCLNLGGISNVTVLGPGREPAAFDIGPANALIDAAIEWKTGGRQLYDDGGSLAAQGRVDTELMARLVDDPYYSLPVPKSTGKEYFNLGYLTSRLGESDMALADLLASVTAATAEIVAAAIRPFAVAELIVAGGGTRNHTLMAELEQRLPGVRMRRMDELGVPGAAKEALAFAIIGFLTLSGLPAIIPSCTGASRASVLGSITPGSGPLTALLSSSGQAPTRVVVRSGVPAS
jgi:anhydro-N-acetylmuramic acid kinase